MASFQNNRIITKLVLLTFKFYFLLIVIGVVLNLWIDLMHHNLDWQDWLWDIYYGLLNITFFINGIFYLSWYYIINVNYLQLVKSESHLNAYWSVLFWLIPFVNIIAPYYRLRNIALTYGNEMNNQMLATKKMLFIWAGTFALWYGLIFYVRGTTPIMAEDLTLFYLEHPLLKYLFDNSRSMLELIGLATMMAVVRNIAALEIRYIEGDEEVEITQHIIERP